MTGLAEMYICNDDGPSYAELLGRVTPPWFALALDLVLVTYGEGAVVTYFLFLANFVRNFDFWPEALDHNMTIMVMAVVVVPLTFFSTVGALTRFASAGLVAVVLMTIGIWIREPELASHRSVNLSVVGDTEHMPAVMCICIFAFMWHTNCVGVARELHNPSPLRCGMVALGGTTLLCMFYLSVAFGGYASWGASLLSKNGSSIVDMYSSKDFLFIGIRVSLTFALLIATPINMYPIRESCVGLMRSIWPRYEMTALHRCLWGSGLVFLTASMAILFPDVVAVITLMGGTLAAFLMVISPTLIAKEVFPPKYWYGILVVNLTYSALLIASALGLIGQSLQ